MPNWMGLCRRATFSDECWIIEDSTEDQKRGFATEAWLDSSVLISPWEEMRLLFWKFDCEGFGEMSCEHFRSILSVAEFRSNVIAKAGVQCLRRLEYRSLTSADPITYQEFVDLISNKRRWSLKVALHERDREVVSVNNFKLLPQQNFRHKMVHKIAEEFLPDPMERKFYEDQYRCFPPPLFIIFITLLELGCFVYYSALYGGEISTNGPVPIDSVFIFRPDKRYEVWRFFLYMVLHAGWVHLLFNLSVQVLVGLPLEMVHGSWRIAIIYLAGIFAGSLGTSIFDPDVYLVGASGGVYALLAAHLANILLNYTHMECRAFRIFCIFLITSADVGFAIWNRYAATSALDPQPVSYVAHLAGALAGLTIGLLVLKSFEQQLHEQYIWWIALTIYGACTLFAIIWNIFFF